MSTQRGSSFDGRKSTGDGHSASDGRSASDGYSASDGHSGGRDVTGLGRVSTTRRGVLAAMGAAAGLGGCVGTLTVLGGERPVSVLAAGSLQSAFADGVHGVVDAKVQTEAHGSVTVARLVASGRRDPDIVALADTALFDEPLGSAWYARFATNALVVAYNENSGGGRRVGAADRWFDPVLAGEASLGRTDPDLDPLGYRTLFALALGEEYYDEPRLRERLLSRDQIYPETSLLGRFETGVVDAAVVYRNMAEHRGYSYVDLPPALDLSDPDRAERYAEASYTLEDGETVRGAPITYGAVARSDRETVRSLFDHLVTDEEYLTADGFTVPDAFPTYSGEVPDGFRA